MLKALVKLALAALIANAVWRIGSEYVTEFKFKDAVREAAMYHGRGDTELKQRVQTLASQFDIPLDDDAIDVERTEGHILVSGAYDKPIELIPGRPYDWHFTWAVDADVAGPGPALRQPTGDTDAR